LFLVQDEARAKRFAGTGPEAGDDLLRLPFLEQLAGDLGGERAARDALPDHEATAGFLAALPARAAVGLRVLLDDLAGLGAAARAEPQLDALGAELLLVERRSEEHTSELQSRFDLVCRLLLEKK